MISRADALMLRGLDVSVTYRRQDGALMTRTGTLQGANMKVKIEVPESGRIYRIPLVQVMAIRPLDPIRVHNFLQDGVGAALSSRKE